MNAAEITSDGATVVITHRVREGMEADYDRWLQIIGPLCRAAVGHLDWQVIRPIAGLTHTYTMVIRFDNSEHIRQWMHSEERKHLIEQARPLLAADDAFTIRSGLDFWFQATGGSAKVPVRWKQYLLTWSAIFPLVLVTPWVVVPVLHALGVPDYPALSTLVVTATVVFLMVYVIMPRYTKLVRSWLFK